MKNKGFLTLFAILIAFLPLRAQQEGSVAISEQIVPATDNITNNFVMCVERLIVVGTSNKDARRDCLKSTGKAAKLASDGFDDASGAANANRPIFVSNGYGGSYIGRSYTSRRYRRRTPRVAPQASRQATVSRQSASTSVRRVPSPPVRRASVRSLRSR